MKSVVIIDFGSQTTQLIARRLRELGYLSTVQYPQDVVDVDNTVAIILSGGPDSVFEEGAQKVPAAVWNSGLPVLGICYGMQSMAHDLGGSVQKGTHGEFGPQVVACVENPILSFVQNNQWNVWMSHGDHVHTLPAGFSAIGQAPGAPICIMVHADKKYVGVQFHPEVTHTDNGIAFFKNFMEQYVGVAPNWSMQQVHHTLIEQIRTQVGSDNVLLGLSGGVDSAVAGALIHEAVGKQLTCVFVDTGLLRLNERAQVEATFRARGVQLVVVDAADTFMENLAGVSDPEQKRKIIGRVFVEIFEQEAKKLPNIQFLAQGTIYPDVIESAGTKAKAKVIKSHHNVGGLPEKMHLQLLEPMTMLFKDEVRKLGAVLGLPDAILNRHPFPGPGLGVRILGKVDKASADVLRKVDHIFLSMLVEEGHYHKVSQAFAVFLPVQSVGVVGDARRYAHVVALRAVTTDDFMSAHWAYLPYEFLSRVSTRIINEVEQVSRVVYDISSKPPATIEWE